jgi:hypothetical protein
MLPPISEPMPMTDAPAAITQPSPPEKKSTNVYCTIFFFIYICNFKTINP